VRIEPRAGLCTSFMERVAHLLLMNFPGDLKKVRRASIGAAVTGVVLNAYPPGRTFTSSPKERQSC
jgi:hypothetical protein